MTWLMENPATIIAGGVLVELALAAALFRTGRVVILGGMFLAALLTLGLLLTERVVVTDGESVRITLDGAAGALMTNDPGKVLNFIDPQAVSLREQVKGVLQRISFKDAHIAGDVDLDIHPDITPPTATAKFWARVSVSERHGGGMLLGHEEGIERLTVGLHKIDKRWLVTSAEAANRRF